ncbi:phage tail protein [Pseudomonas protegens]|uniref:phage tail protein n=1 Tax=Pseudomonas protegens TaxID=380021 RepID=UPI000CCF295D|nr:phage tail protein [Pseudomonas protegens]PNV99009.1 phage tail protein [Pseudomonas protegens]
MADTQTVEKKSVLLTGIDQLSPKLVALQGKVDSFKKNLEQTGLGKLDISGLFKGGSLITPFLDGIKACDAFKGKLAEVGDSSAPADAAKGMNVFSQSMAKVSSAIDAALAPAVGALVVGLEPMLNSVGTLLDDNPKLVEGLAMGAIAFSAMQTAVTGATQVLDLMGTVTKASPVMLIAMGIALAAGVIIANWTPISAFFVSLWEGVKSFAAQAMEVLSALFGWTPLGTLIGNWGAITAFFAGLWDSIQAMTASIVGFLKEVFSWSPLGLIINNWAGLTGLFASIWESLKALTVPAMAFLKGLFDWGPMDMITRSWGAVTGFFASIWAELQPGIDSIRKAIEALFDWSPMELIMTNWAPIADWFSGLWSKLQELMVPIKELFEGGFGGLIATVTAKVEGFTEAQKQTNAEGKGGLASPFAATQGSSLTQNSSALIQQNAANNRTQLEGGLTLRFENAPAGLRAEQATTNQPGLNIASTLGYRSLSLGGSHGG